MSTELTVLGQPGTVERHLGRGATGEVVLARLQDDRRVVVKLARDAAAYARLAEEGYRLWGVESPFCVRLLGAGRTDQEIAIGSGSGRARVARGTPYLVLAHEGGVPLAELGPVGAAGRLALAVARDIGRALSDLHLSGVAHGDVKPENILMDGDAEQGFVARLFDFGLADVADAPSARGGTRRYLAPEVLDPDQGGDARARDLYALGVTLSELAGPGALEPLIRPLLARAPGARPGADWVVRRAFELLDQVEPEAEQRARRSGRVRRAYLSLRRGELLVAAHNPKSSVAVAGPAGDWLRAWLSALVSLEELRGPWPSSPAHTLADLDRVGRRRWLVELAGAPAAAWPELEVGSDSDLAARLSSAIERVEPSQLTFLDLELGSRPLADPVLSPAELALRLGRGSPSNQVIDQAEQRAFQGTLESALTLALARALRLRGELGRALAVLETLGAPRGRVEVAEVLRRAGDAAQALTILQKLEIPSDLDTRARALSCHARILLDQGHPDRALALLSEAPPSAPVLEVKALLELSLGQRDRARATLESASLLAIDDEERARVEAVFGNLAHFEGDPARALAASRRAAEHAARAGAVLEEATYLTGVAAAATNLGELFAALQAAERSQLLFESLGRTREAARALLSQATVHAFLGGAAEAREAAQAALSRARLSGDKRCRAYAHLLLSDLTEPGDPEALEHARFAASLCGDDPEDALRLAPRRHRAGDALDLDAIDHEALQPKLPLDLRLEWWTARATVASEAETSHAPERVLQALLGAVGSQAPCVLRGPAFAAGAELAARLGDGDAVRRLTLAAAEAGRELSGRTDPSLLAKVRQLPWIRLGDAGQTSPFSPEQLLDVDRLVRALGRRDRLRPLLEQVIDALVLWTGVERGLLLLRAPGGKLRPRAARNLLRSDLEGAQLELSHSLAERALAQGEPVVAVDASGDLPEIHKSVHALKLRSVLAVPLIARGEALGVVYLDDRVRRGAFGPRELAFVRLVATLAAVAIADARDQILLRRSARRARRAERRLSGELAQREAELDLAGRELARARDSRGTRFRYDTIVGQSEAIRSMLRLVDRVATSDVPLLILGESGSGKELVARAVHQHGRRAERPFVAENCGAIPETLLESTLFGHVRGAFTGAARQRAGLFEVADQGSLLLDEIGEMSLAMQAKLLRALQDGEIRPVGSERSRHVDVRVIGATHRDLSAMVEAGAFREDLYYRLNVITIPIPSLRERVGDIPLLVKHFVGLHRGGRSLQVSPAAMQVLSAYPWPGNARQLENEVRRALVLSDRVITPEHLSPEITRGGVRTGGSELNLRRRVDLLEADLVRSALKRTEGNQTRAAALLGLSRFGLQKMMKRLEIGLSREGA